MSAASITEQLGIEYPIVAFSHCRDVVAAVSRAGGFGVLGVTTWTPERLEAELDWIGAQTAGRPYGVDLVIPAKFAGGDQGGLGRDDAAAGIPAAHRQFAEALLERYDVPAAIDAVDEFLDFTNTTNHVLIDIALERQQIRLIANALGPSPGWIVDEAHSHEVLVAALVGNRQHAERQVANGVDIIVAQGYEAGGHTGEIATMVLTPDVVDAVAPVPVLAAGGIASGRQMAAAMALGAQGVWTGSVWLTTEEAETHPAVTRKMLEASSSDTVRSRSRTGKPCRVLRSAWTDAWDAEDSPAPLPMPLQSQLCRAPWDRVERAAHQPGSGAARLITYPVGQVVGQMHKVRPARDVLLQMVEDYVETIARMSAQLTEI